MTKARAQQLVREAEAAFEVSVGELAERVAAGESLDDLLPPPP